MNGTGAPFIDRNRGRVEAFVRIALGLGAAGGPVDGAVDFVGRILSECPDWETRVQALLDSIEEASERLERAGAAHSGAGGRIEGLVSAVGDSDGMDSGG